MKSPETITPETAVLDTFVQGRPFQVVGDYDVIVEQKERADVYIKTLTDNAPQTAVEPVQPVVAPKPAYEDFNSLAPREVVRRKIQAFIFDKRNGTNMLDLLNQRIADDRNLAMAQKLGLISSVHCAKHERVVAKLKHLV